MVVLFRDGLYGSTCTVLGILHEIPEQNFLDFGFKKNRFQRLGAFSIPRIQYGRTRGAGRPDVYTCGEMVATGPVRAYTGELKRGSLGPIGAAVPTIIDFIFFSISGGRIG
jgi:hypothetical protein